MATTTRKPRRNHAPQSEGDITIAQHTLPKAHTGQATTMQVIVQDRYGAAPEDVLRLAEIDRPTIGSGTMKAVGADVTGFTPGDEVFGVRNGSFAEYARPNGEARAEASEPLL